MNILEMLKSAKTNIAADIGAIPQIARGQVWCKSCGATKRLDGVKATLGGGWPKCCGYTMTIDSPAEQASLATKKPKCHFVTYLVSPCKVVEKYNQKRHFSATIGNLHHLEFTSIH